MTHECVNLKEMFGDRYKATHEESYFAEHGENAIREDPWLLIIPCYSGHICPWGGNDLAACTDKAGPVVNRLKALPFATVAQDGSDGANIVFDVVHFNQVAEIMKPRRRKRLSEEQKRANAERLRQYQPAKGQSVTDLARQRSREAPESHPGSEAA